MPLTLNSKALAYLKGLKTKEEIEIFLEGLGMAQGTDQGQIWEERAAQVIAPEAPASVRKAQSRPSTSPKTPMPSSGTRKRNDSTTNSPLRGHSGRGVE